MIVNDNSETLKNALARIEQLERENAALLADARRYQFLRSRMYVGVSILRECLWCIRGLYENSELTLDETIDAAIDAEMKEKA